MWHCSYLHDSRFGFSVLYFLDFKKNFLLFNFFVHSALFSSLSFVFFLFFPSPLLVSLSLLFRSLFFVDVFFFPAQSYFLHLSSFFPLRILLSSCFFSIPSATGLSAHVLKGREPWSFRNTKTDADKTLPADNPACKPIDYPKADGVLSFDLLSNLALSGVKHEHDQPAHLRVRKGMENVPSEVSGDVKYPGGAGGGYCCGHSKTVSTCRCCRVCHGSRRHL